MGCWLGLLPVPDTGKGPLIVLGYPFLRQVYTVLDAGDTPRVGFAPAKHGGKAEQDDHLQLAAVRPSVDVLTNSSANLRATVMKKDATAKAHAAAASTAKAQKAADKAADHAEAATAAAKVVR